MQVRQAIKQNNTANPFILRARTAHEYFKSLDTILDARQIQDTIDRMAVQIAEKLQDTAPIVLTVYPEGAHFSNRLTKKLADLNFITEEYYIDFRLEDDILVKKAEPLVKLTGRTVLITTGIFSDGLIHHAVLQYCKEQSAKTVYCATMVNVPQGRLPRFKNLQPSFYGIESDAQLVGFGMDFDGFFRNEMVLRKSKYASQGGSSFKVNHMLQEEKSKHSPLLTQDAIPLNQAVITESKKIEAIISKLKLVMDREKIEHHIKHLAETIQNDFMELDPVVLTMQKGGSHFSTWLTELMPKLKIEEGYLHITRYGHSKEGGQAKILVEPTVDLKQRVVIIIEDLIEGGLTMKLARKLCLDKGAESVYTVVFADKPELRIKGLESVKPDYCCVVLKSNAFLVGMGLDEKGLGRSITKLLAHPVKPKPQIKNPSPEETTQLKSRL